MNSPSPEDKTGSKLESARNAVTELETRFSIACATWRALLNDVEEENRRLHRESAKRDFQVFTEAEFAAIFKVSEPTMTRERLDGRIKPLMVRGKIRYTNEHLERAHEIFSARTAAKKKRQSRGGLEIAA